MGNAISQQRPLTRMVAGRVIWDLQQQRAASDMEWWFDTRYEPGFLELPAQTQLLPNQINVKVIDYYGTSPKNPIYLITNGNIIRGEYYHQGMQVSHGHWLLRWSCQSSTWSLATVNPSQTSKIELPAYLVPHDECNYTIRIDCSSPDLHTWTDNQGCHHMVGLNYPISELEVYLTVPAGTWPVIGVATDTVPVNIPWRLNVTGGGCLRLINQEIDKHTCSLPAYWELVAVYDIELVSRLEQCSWGAITVFRANPILLGYQLIDQPQSDPQPLSYWQQQNKYQIIRCDWWWRGQQTELTLIDRVNWNEDVKPCQTKPIRWWILENSSGIRLKDSRLDVCQDEALYQSTWEQQLLGTLITSQPVVEDIEVSRLEDGYKLNLPLDSGCQRGEEWQLTLLNVEDQASRRWYFDITSCTEVTEIDFLHPDEFQLWTLQPTGRGDFWSGVITGSNIPGTPIEPPQPPPLDRPVPNPENPPAMGDSEEGYWCCWYPNGQGPRFENSPPVELENPSNMINESDNNSIQTDTSEIGVGANVEQDIIESEVQRVSTANLVNNSSGESSVVNTNNENITNDDANILATGDTTVNTESETVSNTVDIETLNVATEVSANTITDPATEVRVDTTTVNSELEEINTNNITTSNENFENNLSSVESETFQTTEETVLNSDIPPIVVNLDEGDDTLSASNSFNFNNTNIINTDFNNVSNTLCLCSEVVWIDNPNYHQVNYIGNQLSVSVKLIAGWCEPLPANIQLTTIYADGYPWTKNYNLTLDNGVTLPNGGYEVSAQINIPPLLIGNYNYKINLTGVNCPNPINGSFTVLN